MNSSEIFTGHLYAPDAVSIPTVQNPMRPEQPIVYARGQGFSIYVKYPKNTKRLLFTISKRIISESNIIFRQMVYPKVNEDGIAQFFVDGATTLAMKPDLYYWDVFQLHDDGTRDIWAPYNTGTFSIVNTAPSSSLELDTLPLNDIYNQQVTNTRRQNLEITRGLAWDLKIRWSAGGSVMDLNGYNAYLTATNPTDSQVIVIDLSSPDNGIFLDPDTDIITASMTEAQTEALTAGIYPYYMDVWKDNLCNKITLISGNMVVQDPG